VVPRLFTHDVAGLVNFLRQTFGARGEVSGGVPVEVRIGDSIVLVSDGGGVREPLAGFLYVYVEDADAVYGAAINAGAVSIEAPTDTPYGDRRATVRDPWGNTWQIARYKGASRGAVP
jgi:PhnB protein